MSGRHPSPIVSPRWTRPAVVGADGRMQIALDRPLSRFAVFLQDRGGATTCVALGDISPMGGGGISHRAHVAGVAPGLYDLHLVVGGDRHVERRAVRAIDDRADGLRLAHCSDLHLLKPVQGAMEDRDAHIAALVVRLNALGPDVVVCTGDLVSRYDTDKRPLPAATIRRQIRRVRAHLSALKAPLYVTVGNHDAAFDDTRPCWYAAMGGRAGPPEDWSVDWGPYHLTMMDCFARYDRQNVALETSFTPRQLSWLEEDLRAAGPEAVRVLMIHYDYRAQLPPILARVGVDALFYGHSGPLYPEELAQHAIWDGHLPAELAYRLVRLEGRIVVEEDSAAWTSLVR